MTVTVLIFTNHTLERQLFVKNFYGEIHENPTKSLVSDNRSHTDGQTGGRGVYMHVLFSLCKERLKPEDFFLLYLNIFRESQYPVTSKIYAI
jgi:hypothetical protein